MNGSAATARPGSSPTKVVIASLLGTAMEWYDFFLFGTMTAIALAPLFFRPLEGHSKDSLYHRRALVMQQVAGDS